MAGAGRTSAMLFFAFFLYRFCTRNRICANSTEENCTILEDAALLPPLQPQRSPPTLTLD